LRRHHFGRKCFPIVRNLMPRLSKAGCCLLPTRRNRKMRVTNPWFASCAAYLIDINSMDGFRLSTPHGCITVGWS